MRNPTRRNPKKVEEPVVTAIARALPDPQAVADIEDRYWSWLIKRDAKRLQSLRAHWAGGGKKPAVTQA
jgi:hypothetical protein